MKTRHTHALIALFVILTSFSILSYAGEAQSVSEASDGFDPERAKIISDTLLEIVKDWWLAVILPALLALGIIPGVRKKIGQGMQSAGKKIQPKGKDE